MDSSLFLFAKFADCFMRKLTFLKEVYIMELKKKCQIAEQVGEFVLGCAIGACISKNVLPNCNGIEKIFVSAGAGVCSWMAGKTFAKHFYKFCDDTFGADFKEEIAAM